MTSDQLIKSLSLVRNESEMETDLALISFIYCGIFYLLTSSKLVSKQRHNGTRFSSEIFICHTIWNTLSLGHKFHSILWTYPGRKNRHQIVQDLIRSYTYKIFCKIFSQDPAISYVFVFFKISSDSDCKMSAKILQESDGIKRTRTANTKRIWSYTIR